MAQFLEARTTRKQLVCLNMDHIISFTADEGDRGVKVEMLGGHVFFFDIAYDGFYELVVGVRER